MKKLVYTFLYLCICSLSFSQQDSSAFEKLLVQFKTNYYEIAAKDATYSFVDLLREATRKTLYIKNPVFRNTKKQLAPVLKYWDTDSLLAKIADSVYKTFTNRFFWQDQKIEYAKFQRVLALYSEKLCSCISSHPDIKKEDINIWEIAEGCDKKLSSDALLTSRINAEIRMMSVNDRMKIQPLVYKHLYQECPAFYDAVNLYFFPVILFNYWGYKDNLVADAEERMFRFFKQNKGDLLLLLFPEHAAYKSDIEKTSGLNDKKSLYIISRKQEPILSSEIYTDIKTFYTGGEKPAILAQTLCAYTLSDSIVKIKSYQFLTPDKITNKAELLKEIKDIPEPPPPPMEPKLKSAPPPVKQ